VAGRDTFEFKEPHLKSRRPAQPFVRHSSQPLARSSTGPLRAGRSSVERLHGELVLGDPPGAMQVGADNAGASQRGGKRQGHAGSGVPSLTSSASTHVTCALCYSLYPVPAAHTRCFRTSVAGGGRRWRSNPSDASSGVVPGGCEAERPAVHEQEGEEEELGGIR